MKLTRFEQETVILYNQAEETAEVYTHNPTLTSKLLRLSEKYPDQIIRKDELHFIVPKRCVLIREPYSEARRKVAREKFLAGQTLPNQARKEQTE